MDDTRFSTVSLATSGTAPLQQIDFEQLMADSDPEQTGQALNLITFNKEGGFQLAAEARELLMSD
jgi:hypothetical protein